MSDIDILARTLYGEAKPNDMEDAAAIACVVMNRVHHKLWPDDATAVCLQPLQFSCWNHNDPNRERILSAKGKWFEKCKSIARLALKDELADETQRATHYHTRKSKPRWSKGHKPCFETDGHLFFNDIDTPPPASAKEALDQHRPLGSTGTVRGAQVGIGSAVGVGAAAEAIRQLEPALPLLTSLVEYAPWFICGCLALGMIYMVWRRHEDRQAGLR